MTYFLGIFGGAGPNPSAALVRDRQIVALVEEERLSRVKCAPNALPISSIREVLSLENIGLDEVAGIGFAWDVDRYQQQTKLHLDGLRKTFTDKAQAYNEGIEQSLRLSFSRERLLHNLKIGLAKVGLLLDPQKVTFLSHHLCHAASSYYLSGFSESAILTVDGSGEEFCSVGWVGDSNGLRQVYKYELPHTLGGYYSTFTEFLGFKPNEHEGKLMGLAPFGSFRSDLQDKLDLVIPFDMETGDYQVVPGYRYFGTRMQGQTFSEELVELFGCMRRPTEPLDREHKDLAFNVQWRLEKILIGLARRLVSQTGSGNLCMAGGVAMNCKANGVLAEQKFVENLFIQPASSDNGAGLGAALTLENRMKSPSSKPRRLRHCYYGRAYNNDQIEAALKHSKLEFFRLENAVETAATLVSKGKIIGWFQGRAEFGARALGARSILADPTDLSMLERINYEVKNRERWRPFCPSVLDEDFDLYFEKTLCDEFMITAYEVKPEVRPLIPSAVHIDGTARPQRVRKEDCGRYYYFISELKKRTGHGVCLNTSFNIQGEPMVYTPAEAIRCFAGTGLDALVIGDWCTLKPGVRLE